MLRHFNTVPLTVSPGDKIPVRGEQKQWPMLYNSQYVSSGKKHKDSRIPHRGFVCMRHHIAVAMSYCNVVHCYSDIVSVGTNRDANATVH